MRCAIVIPARMDSTRFPGKPLADLCGKPMVQWVWEAAMAAGVADRVLIATPDEAIIQACNAFGAESILTSDRHPTGTDRIAEVAQQVEADVYVNVQGDEPLIKPQTIRDCAEAVLDHPEVEMASAWCPCPPEDQDNPAAVKVVTEAADFALYFSRHAIPFPRSTRVEPVKKHVGIYVFGRNALLGFAEWPQSPLEIAESLEQLRFLHYGVRIKMVHVEPTEVAVDTPEQAEEARRWLAQR